MKFDDKDFVKIKFYYFHEGENVEKIESLWATRNGPHFRIESIPFYVTEYAYGDIVSTTSESNGELFVDELVKESGHSTIRVVFFDELIVEMVRKELKEQGCDSELSDKAFLIAVDIPPHIDYHKIIKPYLENGITQDLWDYQEACISSVHAAQE